MSFLRRVQAHGLGPFKDVLLYFIARYVLQHGDNLLALRHFSVKRLVYSAEVLLKVCLFQRTRHVFEPDPQEIENYPSHGSQWVAELELQLVCDQVALEGSVRFREVLVALLLIYFNYFNVTQGPLIISVFGAALLSLGRFQTVCGIGHATALVQHVKFHKLFSGKRLLALEQEHILAESVQLAHGL